MRYPERQLSIGSRFGRWTVVGRPPSKVGWSVRCDCGTEATRAAHKLTSGHSKSCGCYRASRSKADATKHGYAGTPLHKIWLAMRSRCNSPRNKSYADYGGRGIKVSDSWASFENFLSDMGDRPEGWMLERVDNNGHYCKENCRWASREAQNNNTRRNVFVRVGSTVQTAAQWARHLGVRPARVYKAIKSYGGTYTDEQHLREAASGA